jgi:hypothetical protein
VSGTIKQKWFLTPFSDTFLKAAEVRMIRLLGSPKRLCVGPTRRDLLHLGGWRFSAWG